MGYVSKSGGLSNELNNIVARNSDGVYEGVAIGGDRYPGSTFIEHLLRFEANPDIKMMVMFGEVGGLDEYEVVEALKDGRIQKPLVAWCIGTCSKIFPTEVQFGHAGARAGADRETADAKNKALREAGAVVPNSFDDFDAKIKETYERLVKEGKLVPRPDVAAAAHADGLCRCGQTEGGAARHRVHDHHLRRPRRRAQVLRRDHQRRGGAGLWAGRRAGAAVVQEETAAVGHELPGNGGGDHRRPRPGRVRRAQRHRRRPRGQGPDLGSGAAAC